MRQPLLAALAAITLIFPSTAKGSPEWVDHAQQVFAGGGVRLTYGPGCPVNQLAAYRPTHRNIHICKAATLGGWPMVIESIAHEAIHAAQHCAATLVGSRRQLVPLGAVVHRQYGENSAEFRKFQQFLLAQVAGKTDRVYASSRGDSYASALELEAYAFEGHPRQALDVFRAFCQ
jgi:hypothetical protein